MWFPDERLVYIFFSVFAIAFFVVGVFAGFFCGLAMR